MPESQVSESELLQLLVRVLAEGEGAANLMPKVYQRATITAAALTARRGRSSEVSTACEKSSMQCNVSNLRDIVEIVSPVGVLNSGPSVSRRAP